MGPGAKLPHAMPGASDVLQDTNPAGRGRLEAMYTDSISTQLLREEVARRDFVAGFWSCIGTRRCPDSQANLLSLASINGARVPRDLVWSAARDSETA